MKKTEKSRKKTPLPILCSCAVLCGLSVVIGWLCKNYLTLTVLGSGVRITLENQPIILAGICFGPFWGGAVGLASDLLSTAVSQYGLGGINPWITVGAMTVGLTAGLVSGAWHTRTTGKLGTRIFCSTFAAHLIGSGLLKTLGLYFYHFYVSLTVGSITFSSLWLRLPTYLLIGTAESYLNLILLKNKAFAAQLERIQGKNR